MQFGCVQGQKEVQHTEDQDGNNDGKVTDQSTALDKREGERGMGSRVRAGERGMGDKEKGQRTGYWDEHAYDLQTEVSLFCDCFECASTNKC